MAIIPTAAVVAFDKNSVLLVKHGAAATHLTDRYGLPGGTLESQETDRDCALREFIEETGLNTAAEDLIEFPDNFYQAEIEKKDGSRHTYPWRVFLCKKFSGTLKTSQETKPEWTNISEIDNLNLLPNVKSAITAAIKFLNK